MTNHSEILKTLEKSGPQFFEQPDCGQILAGFYPQETFKAGFEGALSLTYQILEEDLQEGTSPLLEKLAAVMAEYYPAINGWDHSICHLFEGKGLILKQTEYLPAAGILVNRGAEGANTPPYSCFNRMLLPVLAYNIDHMIETGDMDRFVFKPGSLGPGLYENGNGMLDMPDRNPVLDAFTDALNPAEFINSIAEMSENILHESSIAGEFGFRTNLQTLILRHMGEDAADKFMLMSKNDTIFGGIKLGVYCDVEGTLLDEGKLHSGLADYLEYLRSEKKVNVTVFTDGDAERLTEDLSRLGMPQSLLPVVSKSKFRNYPFSHLDILIDDTQARAQGLSACNQLHPEFFKASQVPALLVERFGPAPKMKTDNSPAP